jgi:hypothetical protein
MGRRKLSEEEKVQGIRDRAWSLAQTYGWSDSELEGYIQKKIKALPKEPSLHSASAVPEIKEA